MDYEVKPRIEVSNKDELTVKDVEDIVESFMEEVINLPCQVQNNIFFSIRERILQSRNEQLGQLQQTKEATMREIKSIQDSIAEITR